MTTTNDHDDVEPTEIVDSKSTYQTHDTWKEDVDDEDDEDGDLFDAAPGNAHKSVVDWADNALRALKPTTDVGGDVMPSVKRWALAGQSAVMQCWGKWTGHEKAIAETREVANNTSRVCVRKPVELSLHEKRLLKAKLVKRVANEKRNLAMHRD
jgi:hypothetical protein